MTKMTPPTYGLDRFILSQSTKWSNTLNNAVKESI